VERDLNPVSNYSLLALAEQGYVIFMPNSCGREDRIKPAIYDEGTPNILRWYDYGAIQILPPLIDMWGFDNPYEPKDIASAIEQSSLFRLDRVHTPVLVAGG